MMEVIGIDCPGGVLDSLVELRDFIKGTGRFRLLGNGMHTYPGRDKNNQKIYDACLQLEAMGLIRRTINDPGHVVWVAKEGQQCAIRIDGIPATAASFIAMTKELI